MIEFYINNVYIDLKDDIPFPLSYSTADIKDPSKRKRDMSKTVALPDTATNRQFFSSAYNITISDLAQDGANINFDPTLKYPSFATRNGKLIFSGFTTLQDVEVMDDVLTFNVVSFSSVVDLFSALGDMNLSELGWSEYDHVLSIANIVATWTATKGSGVWYPLIDFGYTNNLLSYKTNDLLLAVYWKEVIEKCLAVQNYTLDSTHINTTIFKQHTIVRGGGEKITISSAEAASRHVNYTGDGSTPYEVNGVYNAFPPKTTFNNVQVIPISDNGFLTLTQVDDPTSQFSESTGFLDVANSGKYRLSVTGTFDIYYDFSTALTDELFRFKIKCKTLLNGIPGQLFVFDVVTPTAGNTSIPVDLVVDYDLNANDDLIVFFEIESKCYALDNGVGETLDVTFDFNNDLTYDLTAVNEALVDGDTVNVASFLPVIKAVDFFKDVILAHNLYVSEPNEDGVVKIEPISTYYTETNNFDDWSDLHDKSKVTKIVPSINLVEGAEYSFRFTEDRDHYKQDYYNKYGIDYGDYLYKVPGNFKKGVKLFQFKTFAQSVPVALDGTDLIIPRVVTINETSGFSSPFKGKARVFLNNGAIACDSWNLVNSDTLAPTAQTVYPQAHHLNSLSSATYDLNWQYPTIVYYTATTYTTRNLFSLYYQESIREIASRDGKMLVAYFKLTENDLYRDFMRKLVMWNGALFKKNLIKDFDVTKDKTVMCELIKVIQGRTKRYFAPATATGQLPTPSGSETITTDTTVTTQQKSYVVDTTGGDVTVTFDATTYDYIDTSEWNFVKIGGNDLIFTIVGTTLSGVTSDTIKKDFDAPNIIFKQGAFYYN